MAYTDRMFFVLPYYSIFLTGLTILTEWIPHSEIADREYVPNAYFQGQGIWITVTNLDNGCNKKLPRLYSVYSLGCLYTTSCYMVQYQPVDTDKLRSISLANNDHSLLDSDTSKNDNDSSCISAGGIINGLMSNNKSAKQLQKKSNNNNHDSNNHKSYNYTNTDLEYIVAQINAGQDLFVTVENYLNKNHGGQQNVRKSYSWSPKYEVIKIFLIPIIFIAWVWFIFIHYLKKIIDYRFLNLSNIFYSYWHTTLQIRCTVDNIPYRSSSSYISTYATEERIVRELSGVFVANLSAKSHLISLQWKKSGSQISRWTMAPTISSTSFSISLIADHDKLWFCQETANSIINVNGLWKSLSETVDIKLDEESKVITGYSVTVQPQVALLLKDRRQEYISMRLVVDGIPYHEGAFRDFLRI